MRPVVAAVRPGQAAAVRRDLDGIVAAQSPSDRNVGCVPLRPERQIEPGAHDRPFRRPFQKAYIDQRINDMAAIVGAKRPETHRLSERQLEARHLHEFRTNAIDDSSEAHSRVLEQPPGQSGPYAVLTEFLAKTRINVGSDAKGLNTLVPTMM